MSKYKKAWRAMLESTRELMTENKGSHEEAWEAAENWMVEHRCTGESFIVEEYLVDCGDAFPSEFENSIQETIESMGSILVANQAIGQCPGFGKTSAGKDLEVSWRNYREEVASLN